MLAAVCNGVNCHVLLSTFYLSLFFGDWHCRDEVFCIWWFGVGVVSWLFAEIFYGWIADLIMERTKLGVFGCLGWCWLVVDGLMLLCCSLLYFCLLYAHMTIQALNKHTISLSRLDYLHVLWKICSCVVYQLYILVQHPLCIFV